MECISGAFVSQAPLLSCLLLAFRTHGSVINEVFHAFRGFALDTLYSYVVKRNKVLFEKRGSDFDFRKFRDNKGNNDNGINVMIEIS